MDAVPLTTTQRQRVAALIGNCSIELSPRDELAGEALRRLLDPGTSVFVNHPPSVTHHDIVAACARLRRAGFVPVPHVAARRLASFTQASDFLQRAAGEAAVDRILLIGGDDSPVGPFRASLDLLATGLIERHGIGNVAFGGYPEGHPAIDARTLDTALQAKVALARQRGLAVSLVTQFGFEAQPILRWIAALRARGIDCPVHVGVAGPASVATLAKFADPLWHRRVAPRTGARPHGIRAHPRRGGARRPDRRTGGRRGRPCADRRSACLHLWRRAPHCGVGSRKHLNRDPRGGTKQEFRRTQPPKLRRISATNLRDGNRVSFLFSNVSPADISAPSGGGEPMIRTMFVLLAMAAGGTAAQARHVTHDLDLVNRSRATVASFFASNTGADHWDVDLLARHGLQPNHFVQLDLDDQAGACHYDFKMVLTDGSTVIRRNVNVCERRIYTLTD